MYKAACACKCVHTHLDTYTCIYMHTHTCIHTYACLHMNRAHIYKCSSHSIPGQGSVPAPVVRRLRHRYIMTTEPEQSMEPEESINDTGAAHSQTTGSFSVNFSCCYFLTNLPAVSHPLFPTSVPRDQTGFQGSLPRATVLPSSWGPQSLLTLT